MGTSDAFVEPAWERFPLIASNSYARRWILPSRTCKRQLYFSPSRVPHNLRGLSETIPSAAAAIRHPAVRARAASEASFRDFISYPGFLRRRSGRHSLLWSVANRGETGACWH